MPQNLCVGDAVYRSLFECCQKGGGELAMPVTLIGFFLLATGS